MSRTVRRNPIAMSLRTLRPKVRNSAKAYRRHAKHRAAEAWLSEATVYALRDRSTRWEG
jgi:hypothetical protein